MKKLRSYTLTEVAIGKLEELSERLGISKNGVLELLIHNSENNISLNEEIAVLMVRRGELLDQLTNIVGNEENEIWLEIYAVQQELRTLKELEIERLRLGQESISINTNHLNKKQYHQGYMKTIKQQISLLIKRQLYLLGDLEYCNKKEESIVWDELYRLSKLLYHWKELEIEKLKELSKLQIS